MSTAATRHAACCWPQSLVCFAAGGRGNRRRSSRSTRSATSRSARAYANGVLLPTNQWVSPLGTRIFQDNARIVTSSISPERPVPRRADLERLLHHAHDPQSDERHEHSQTGVSNGATTSRRRTRTPTRTAASRPTARCGRPTATRSGSRRPTTSTSSPSTRHRRWSADQRDLALRRGGTNRPPPARVRHLRPRHHRRLLHPVGHGALARWQQALRRPQRLQRARRDRYLDRRQLIEQIPVGNAPRQVVISADGNTAYVSNEGGRPANSDRLHQPLRRHADRLEPGHRSGDHRHGLRRQPDDRHRRPRRSRSACSRPRCIRTARRCSSPTRTTTASR